MENKAVKSVYETLSKIKIDPKHIEKKNGLTYLSWAFAWAYVKDKFPEAYFTIYENSNGLNYHTDGRTCWVKTGVTIEGLEMIEYLPVMDFRNNSIPLERVTSTDINKTIQRSLTKAAARHGLGLYIYAGGDLPLGEAEATPQPAPAKPSAQAKPAPATAKSVLTQVLPAGISDEMYGRYETQLRNVRSREELEALAAQFPSLKHYAPWYNTLVAMGKRYPKE